MGNALRHNIGRYGSLQKKCECQSQRQKQKKREEVRSRFFFHKAMRWRLLKLRKKSANQFALSILPTIILHQQHM